MFYQTNVFLSFFQVFRFSKKIVTLISIYGSLWDSPEWFLAALGLPENQSGRSADRSQLPPLETGVDGAGVR